MKLYYYRSPEGVGNFGDDLNPYILGNLLTEILDDNASSQLIGIGTILNDRLPRNTKEARHRIVFSSGVGYNFDRSLKINSSYKFYCVRGPLSAKSLGLNSDLAVTDGALLIRRIFSPEKRTRFKFSYMPHWRHASQEWKMVCESLGFGYIDPRNSIQDVLTQLTETDVLLAEAMHGAIVADALRIPWIPVYSHSSILPFKWQDWCLSIGIEYQPKPIRRPRHKKLCLQSSLPLKNTFRNWVNFKLVAASLRKTALTSSPILSKEVESESLLHRLEDKLDQFIQDTKNGLFI
jgi:succinoglycan biosynthesis protein ExoV